jgi:ketosteroid isomerase-like protein
MGFSASRDFVLEVTNDDGGWQTAVDGFAPPAILESLGNLPRLFSTISGSPEFEVQSEHLSEFGVRRIAVRFTPTGCGG